MHLFCVFMIKNKNHNSIRLYQNYGSYLAEKKRFARIAIARGTALALTDSRIK